MSKKQEDTNKKEDVANFRKLAVGQKEPSDYVGSERVVADFIKGFHSSKTAVHIDSGFRRPVILDLTKKNVCLPDFLPTARAAAAAEEAAAAAEAAEKA